MKLPFLALCLFFFSSISSAQEWRYGFQAGIASFSPGMRTTGAVPYFGASITRKLNNRFSLEGGVRYTRSFFDEKFDNLYIDNYKSYLPNAVGYIKASNFQLPLNLRYRIAGNRFSWKAGAGLVPEFIFGNNVYATWSDRYKLSSDNYAALYIVPSVSLFSFDYKVTDRLSIGLEQDYQTNILKTPFLDRYYNRLSISMTSSYRFR